MRACILLPPPLAGLAVAHRSLYPTLPHPLNQPTHSYAIKKKDELERVAKANR